MESDIIAVIVTAQQSQDTDNIPVNEFSDSFRNHTVSQKAYFLQAVGVHPTHS